MELTLTNRGRWVIATILLSIGTIMFVFGWTSPFWPLYWGWLGLPWVKTTFPFVVSIIFLILFFISIWLLSKTTPPPIKIEDEPDSSS